MKKFFHNYYHNNQRYLKEYKNYLNSLKKNFTLYFNGRFLTCLSAYHAKSSEPILVILVANESTINDLSNKHVYIKSPD